MANPFQTTHFRQLLAEWNARLKDEGFEDAENGNGVLKLYHSTQFRRKRTLNLIHQQKAYFERATDFLNSHPFGTETDREIWARHSDGGAVREIAKAMNLNVNRVHKAICLIREIMLKDDE
jgi:hypothetical protein